MVGRVCECGKCLRIRIEKLESQENKEDCQLRNSINALEAKIQELEKMIKDKLTCEREKK